jgi:hypothetical protein
MRERTDSMKENAQGCLSQGQGRFLFLHMRKAGGTSIRECIRSLSYAYPKLLVGHAYHSEGSTFKLTCLEAGENTVLVTCMRDPISRIISSYSYEGYMVGVTRYSKTYQRSPFNWTDWIRRSEEEYYHVSDEAQGLSVWISNENYYTRTLVDYYRRDPRQRVTREDLELAKRVLSSFDSIVIMEWMGEEGMIDQLRHVLGLPENDTSVSLPKANYNKGAARHPFTLDAEAHRELVEMNR